MSQQTAADLAEQIRDLVYRKDHVSMVEITRLDGAQGDLQWALDDYNIVLWAGLSELLVDALELLRKTKAIELHPCSPLVYWGDGAALSLPLAKQARKYKKPHWQPVVFRPAGKATAARG
jgi:hypothetical protein